MSSPVSPLTIYLDYRPNIPGSYAILFFTASGFTSITSHIHTWVLFLYGSVSSFFLEVFLHSSPVVSWVPTDLGSSSFSVLSFCLFMLFMGFSGSNTEVVCHSLLHFVRTLHHDLSILCARHSMAHGFIELDNAVVRVIGLISFLWLWFQSGLSQVIEMKCVDSAVFLRYWLDLSHLLMEKFEKSRL